jgi:hypothetical protein
VLAESFTYGAASHCASKFASSPSFQTLCGSLKTDYKKSFNRPEKYMQKDLDHL